MPKSTVTSSTSVTSDPEVVEDLPLEAPVEASTEGTADAETVIEDRSSAQGNRYPETVGSLESTLREAEGEVATLTKQLDQAKARVKDAKAAVKAHKG